VLSRLKDPAYDRSLGLYGKQLLGGGSPTHVAWSVVLYERDGDRNFVRVHADSLDSPFDINSGAKLQLGSTAKLRTLITYLDVIENLHGQLASLPRPQLLARAKQADADHDPLSKWAAEYLAANRDHALKPMLDAAMHRTYSGSPQAFFTGGGVHAYANFEKSEDFERPTVADGLARSINNVYVRIMRDLVAYYEAQSGEARVLEAAADDPARDALLRRFVDQDSRTYLNRFYQTYKGLSPDEALAKLAHRTRPFAKRLAVVFRSVRPEASREALGAFLHTYLPREQISDDELWDLYREYDTYRFSLADRGYIAGVHPLELWLVAYLQKHPDASRDDITQASAEVRQQSYGWLFKGHSEHKQDLRLRILLEQDAFNKGILSDWRRQGYPFGHLVPSLGTAIGSSGDRPDALADLMGIIVNDGLRLPTVDLSRLHFAAGTPYETDLRAEAKPQRVLSPAVAETVKRTLLGPVQYGTAGRLNGVYHTADGRPMIVGGKTGTGDNRYDTFGRGGAVISQRVIDRTATFVFYLGDRFFGTVTAYVPGAAARQFYFTSAIAVQLLKELRPELEPLLYSSPPGGAAQVAARAATPAPETAHRSPASRAENLPSAPAKAARQRAEGTERSAADQLNAQELRRITSGGRSSKSAAPRYPSDGFGSSSPPER
jgi:membrane peptidoglycan carboxypeptidase